MMEPSRLDSEIAGERRLIVHGDAVLIRRAQLRLPAHALTAREGDELVEQERGALRPVRPARSNQRGQRIQPFARFLRIGIDGQR